MSCVREVERKRGGYSGGFNLLKTEFKKIQSQDWWEEKIRAVRATSRFGQRFLGRPIPVCILLFFLLLFFLLIIKRKLG